MLESRRVVSGSAKLSHLVQYSCAANLLVLWQLGPLRPLTERLCLVHPAQYSDKVNQLSSR